MSNKFEGKIAVVTGVRVVLTGYCAGAFAQGAKVIITGRKKEEVEKIADEIDGIGIVCDQSKLSDIDKLVAQVTASFSSIDILFINAGIVLFLID